MDFPLDGCEAIRTAQGDSLYMHDLHQRASLFCASSMASHAMANDLSTARAICEWRLVECRSKRWNMPAIIEITVVV